VESAWLASVGVGLLALLVLLIAFAVSLYNGLVRVRGDLAKAWSNIDVLLQQRHDELKGLVGLGRGAMDEERRLLEAVARLRSDYDLAPGSEGKTAVENELNRTLTLLWERYPALKTGELMRRIQGRLTALEDSIADRRTLFNDTAAIYNTHREKFPERLLAGLLGFRPHAFLEAG
jgi:LemA protein